MNIIKIIKEEINLIKEYITNNEVYLKDYFSMSDEQKKSNLPHEYYYFFEDFLYDEDIDFEMPKEIKQSNYEDEPEEELNMFDSYDLEFIWWLENNNKDLYNKYSNWLFEKINNNTLDINDAEYPAWSYFDDNPKIIKNQWLIHFTDDPISIAHEGFKYGVDEIDKLGLTTQLGEFDKKYGGYNFSYTLSDFPNYARGGHRSGEYKYGNQCVIFRASGIKVYHYGDQEPQVIFYGNTANNIIPIIDGETEKYGIYNNRTNKLLFENEKLEKVVKWVVDNYRQYNKYLTY